MIKKNYNAKNTQKLQKCLGIIEIKYLKKKIAKRV